MSTYAYFRARQCCAYRTCMPRLFALLRLVGAPCRRELRPGFRQSAADLKSLKFAELALLRHFCAAGDATVLVFAGADGLIRPTFDRSFPLLNIDRSTTSNELRLAGHPGDSGLRRSPGR